MARFLALDWDQDQLCVAVGGGGRGGIRLEHATVWNEKHSPTLAEAETLGKQLRERLDAAKIKPAPVLVSLGRDRVVLKDMRYPAVAPSEEPAIVRFQAFKELSDSPDDVVIDFAPLGAPTGGEQRSLVVIARREVIATYEALCKAAGLKLAGITPRPFGALACLQYLAGPAKKTAAIDESGGAVAILVVADTWAEFSVAQGDALVFSRSLATSGTIAGEIRRNLMVYNSQAPSTPVRAVYIASGPEHATLREGLQEVVDVPVHALDPFAAVTGGDLPTAQPGPFASLVGLIHARSTRSELPINFAHPKQPRPPRDPNKRKLVAVAAAVAALLLAGVVWSYSLLADKQQNIDNLLAQKSMLDRESVAVEDDAKRIKAISDWSAKAVNYLDELYDLTDRFPEPTTILMTSLDAHPTPKSTGNKDRHVVKMELGGILGVDRQPVDTLQLHMFEEKYYGLSAAKVTRNQLGIDPFRFRQQFALRVDVEPRTPEEYTRVLPTPEEERERKRQNDRRGGRGGRGGRGERGGRGAPMQDMMMGGQ